MKRTSSHSRLLVGAMLFALSGIVAAQSAQNTTYSYQYDEQGNLIQITDPLGRVTSYTYDDLNRPNTMTDAAGSITRYVYDGRDQLIWVNDPHYKGTEYTVDGFGNLSALSSPDSGNSSSLYDEAGNLKSHTNAKGQTATYQYDALNRLTRVDYADGGFIQYQYDQGQNGLGRLTHITDATGSIAYAYNQYGQIVSDTRVIGGNSYATMYRYDAAGRLSGITYPSGSSIDYVRDSIGRIAQITSTQGDVSKTVVSQATYQPFGPLKSVTFGNSQTDSRTYDLDGRVSGYTLGAQSKTISYDAASRITAITDAANPLNQNSYGYDALDRLTSSLNPTSSLTYAYDEVGNRSSRITGTATTNYSYAPTSNRLTQITGAQNKVVQTDANGSITNNGDNQFSYDARGRMVSATTALGPVQYYINALGQRAQKILPDETLVYHYDKDGRLIGESTPQGKFRAEYIYLDDVPVAVLK